MSTLYGAGGLHGTHVPVPLEPRPIRQTTRPTGFDWGHRPARHERPAHRTRKAVVIGATVWCDTCAGPATVIDRTREETWPDMRTVNVLHLDCGHDEVTET